MFSNFPLFYNHDLINVILSMFNIQDHLYLPLDYHKNDDSLQLMVVFIYLPIKDP